jgi:hypothetical protein
MCPCKSWTGLQGRVTQTECIALEGGNSASFTLVTVCGKLLGKPLRYLFAVFASALASERTLFCLDAAPKAREEGIVWVEHEGALTLISTRVWIDSGCAGDHLLKPGMAADVREGGDDCNLGGVQPFISHRDCDQYGWFWSEPKSCERLRSIALV